MCLISCGGGNRLVSTTPLTVALSCISDVSRRAAKALMPAGILCFLGTLSTTCSASSIALGTLRAPFGFLPGTSVGTVCGGRSSGGSPDRTSVISPWAGHCIFLNHHRQHLCLLPKLEFDFPVTNCPPRLPTDQAFPFRLLLFVFANFHVYPPDSCFLYVASLTVISNDTLLQASHPTLFQAAPVSSMAFGSSSSANQASASVYGS